MDLLILYLIKSTYLYRTIFFLSGFCINLHVLFFYQASIFSCMAYAHLESIKASFVLFRIWQEDNVYVKVLIGLDKLIK